MNINKYDLCSLSRSEIYESGLCYSYIHNNCKAKNCNFYHPKFCKFDGSCMKNDCKSYHRKQNGLLDKNKNDNNYIIKENNNIKSNETRRDTSKNIYNNLKTSDDAPINIINTINMFHEKYINKPYNIQITELVNYSKTNNYMFDFVTCYIIRYPQLCNAYYHPDVVEYITKNHELIFKMNNLMLTEIFYPILEKNYYYVKDISIVELMKILAKFNPDPFFKNNKNKNIFDIIITKKKNNYLKDNIIKILKDLMTKNIDYYIKNLKKNSEYTIWLAHNIEYICQYFIKYDIKSEKKDLTHLKFMINFINNIKNYDEKKESSFVKLFKINIDKKEILNYIYNNILNGFDKHFEIGIKLIGKDKFNKNYDLYDNKFQYILGRLLYYYIDNSQLCWDYIQTYIKTKPMIINSYNWILASNCVYKDNNI
jgi:hypothetical protein